jgi:DoxX-like family
MASKIGSPSVSRVAFWLGWVLSILPALFLLLDGAMKVAQLPFVIEKTVEMGYRESVILPLGIVLIISTLLYLIPLTAGLGAILLTGYLGGAVATHVRHGDPPGQFMVAAIVGVVLWCGLVLRDPRFRAVVPASRTDSLS